MCIITFLSNIEGVLIMANTNVDEKQEVAKHTDHSQTPVSTVVSSNENQHNQSKESDTNKK